MSRDFAVLDLGSNSFHLLVTQVSDTGQTHIVDRLKEKVRIASGLNDDKFLTNAIQERALKALAQFGERLSGIPESNVQIVATDTFRKAKNGPEFLMRSIQTVGFPIEIISGLEEARLIFKGVTHDYPSSETRMVIDIGGGSTEIIVGQYEPQAMSSSKMGCVSWTQKYFSEGNITEAIIDLACQAAARELQPVLHLFANHQPSLRQGTSGSIRAVGKILLAHQISDGTICKDGLDWLHRQLIKAKRIPKLELRGLSDSRRDVLVGGYCILRALFDKLGFVSINPIDSALREGVMVELVGRQLGTDIRQQTIDWLCQRWSVDLNQANRIESLSQSFFSQVQAQHQLQFEDSQRLRWAAQLHEIGMSIAFSGYHRHGAYILENADMYGFTQYGQQILSALVLCHRGKINQGTIERFSINNNKNFVLLLIILRLSVRLSRARLNKIPHNVILDIRLPLIKLFFDDSFIKEHPLTMADLNHESQHLLSAGFNLQVYSLPISPKV